MIEHTEADIEAMLGIVAKHMVANAGTLGVCLSESWELYPELPEWAFDQALKIAEGHLQSFAPASWRFDECYEMLAALATEDC